MDYKKFYKFLIPVFAIFIAVSCTDKEPKLNYIEGHAFGTTYHIQYYSTDFVDVKPGIDSLIDVINKSVSTYIPDSDISKINAGDSTVVIDKYFKEAFEISARLHQETKGYFDPTIGVLRNAYGFGDDKPLKNMDSVTMDSLMNFVGFQKVRIKEDGTIHKDLPEVYFDFNAVAKGSGVDHIGDYLESKGIKNYLVEVGGEIFARGENLVKNAPWTVGIETPDSRLEDRSYESIVTLKNAGLAASGNYRKFRTDSVTGKKYVHTINPLTGSAEMSDVTSATVIAPSCGEADAYATAFMAMGFERTISLLKKLNGVEAYLTYVDDQGENQVFITDGFREGMVE